jgi:hypothetical protein
MKDLSHLRSSAFVVTDPELSIIVREDGLCEDCIQVRERYASEPTLEYSLATIPSSREELIETLKSAIAVLEQLPDCGTLADIATAMGTDMASLEV